jgi:broad specificity phosphatase PhoE
VVGSRSSQEGSDSGARLDGPLQESPPAPSTAPPIRVYLLRHGQTALNAAGALRGHLDPELDQRGVDQVTRLGDVLGRLSLRFVVSSPLRRAVDTAAAVASRAGVPVETDKRLIDRDYGEWAGCRPSELVERFGSVDSAPGVEPIDVVLKRAVSGLEDFADRVRSGAGVIVSHDVVNRLLLHSIDDSLGPLERIPQDTACFNVLERRSGRWVVLSVSNAPAGHDPQPPDVDDAVVSAGPTGGS